MEKPTAAAVGEALRLAEVRCDARGLRWTEPRRRTYELLVEAAVPLKAYDLISSFVGGRGVAGPPTVYRALEFLISEGLVHRIESLNAYLACDGRHGHGSAEFLICECCGRVAELPNGLWAPVEAVAAEHGFRIDRIVVEAAGFCANCA
jgi:Fur family zinc uptake transcriptional regulator